MKILEERVDMPPPSEQWAFIKSLMDILEKKDNNMIVLRGKCERDQELMASHGISGSEILGGISFLG